MVTGGVAAAAKSIVAEHPPHVRLSEHFTVRCRLVSTRGSTAMCGR